MSQEPSTLKLQIDRRKRVSRIRIALICLVSVVLAAVVFTEVILMVKMTSLQNQLDMLADAIYYQQSLIDGQNSELSDDAYIDNGASKVVTVTPAMDSKNTGAEDALSPENIDLSIEEEGVINSALNKAAEGDHHRVYLTFDDGPSENTDAILDILADYNVKATFFVIGRNDEESASHYKRIVEEGHTLAMHSYTHDYSSLYASEQSFIDDFAKLRKLLLDTTGVDCNIYRFPGGSSNKVSNTDISVFKDYLESENVRYFDWNVSSGDAAAGNYSCDDIIENVMSNVVKYKESVVLMHDTAAKNRTVEALPEIIESLQAMDAEILPITDDTLAIHHGSVK